MVMLVEIPRYKAEGCGFYSVWDQWLNPSGRTMALGSTQPLRDMSTRCISWGIKVAGAYGWQICHLRVPTVWKFWKPLPPQPWRPVQGSIGIALLYLLREIIRNIYKPKCTKIRWKVIAPINSVLHIFGLYGKNTAIETAVSGGSFRLHSYISFTQQGTRFVVRVPFALSKQLSTLLKIMINQNYIHSVRTAQ